MQVAFRENSVCYTHMFLKASCIFHKCHCAGEKRRCTFALFSRILLPRATQWHRRTKNYIRARLFSHFFHLIVDALIIAAKCSRSRFNVGTTSCYTSRSTTSSLIRLLISQMCGSKSRPRKRRISPVRCLICTYKHMRGSLHVFN